MNDSKVILITGSSQGMGFDAAKTLAQKGHHVFASMRGSTGKNEDRAAELNKFAEAARSSFLAGETRTPNLLIRSKAVE